MQLFTMSLRLHFRFSGCPVSVLPGLSLGVAGLLVGLVGCAAVDGVGSSQHSIVNGSRASDGAVVVLLNRFGGGLCTGTLIAPRVVLTAKHCVQSPGANQPSPTGAFVVGVGDSINLLSSTFTVSDIATTPGVYYDNGSLAGALVGIDIAVVTLTRAPPIEPYAVFRGEATELVGESIRAVGFGETPSGGAGLKYSTESMVRCIGCFGDSGVIYTGAMICQGDSGGPLLNANNEVVGVSSFGTGACGSGVNGFNRVDRFFDLIDSAVLATDACLNNGAEVCDGADNDCNGLVDETCAEVGEACADNTDCLSLLCEDTDAGRICTQGCDPLRPATGCPPDFYCANVSACDGLCVPGATGGLPNDADCMADTQCMSLRCVDPGDGRKRCLDACGGDRGMCVDGEVCAALPGQCGGCVPARIVVGARGLGEPCHEFADCRTGSCHEELGASYCTRGCEVDNDCGDGFHCRTGETNVCIRGSRGGVGSSCVVNGDCGEGLFCATQAELSWCTRFCDGECPPSFGCEEVAPDTLICVPESRVLGAACTANEECLSERCEVVDGANICTRGCGPNTACDSGFSCRRNDEGTDSRCVPDRVVVEDGGCSAAGSSYGWWCALILAVSFRRRRVR